MNFNTPEKVSSVIEDLKTADELRAPVRSLIDGLFNGDAPYTPEEEKENKIQINVNWKEGTMLLLQARQQYENAFLTTGNYFTITVPDAPQSKAVKINGTLTRLANKTLKASRPFLHTMREKFGSICLHGIGPQMWPDEYNPIPFFVPLEDILIPTDTLVTLENLTHFAVRRRLTPGKLFRKTIGMGKNMDPGWNIDVVSRILESFKDLNQNNNNWNWYEHPEELAELWKQNQSYYDSDATPIIKLWDFYFQGDEAETCWYRVVIPDTKCSPGITWDDSDPLEYIYHKETAYADNLDQLLHVQFGDGNNKPPFKWHSTRSLGFLLFDVVHMMNRLRCQFTQKVFEDMMLLFRITDPVDRSRLDKIYMGLNYGILPEGLNMVRREERYEPNEKMVEMLMANYKQLMGESTASYTQDIDQGTSKERTAFEVQALLTQTAKLTGSMLNLAYVQEAFAYQEICRRLTCKETTDFTAKKFKAACRNAGIDEKWINSDRWDIEPERVLGQGNMQLEQAQAKALLEISAKLNPEAQAKVMHEYVFAVTHDPKRTDALAPIDGAMHVSDSVHDTELVFSAYMTGTAVKPRPGSNPIEVIETMFRHMNTVIQGIMKGGGVGTPQQVMGLQGCAMYVQTYIDNLAQDKDQKDRVTAYGKVLGKMMNEVKGMAQRQAQAAKQAQGNGVDPEAMAAIQAKQAETQVKIRGKQASDALKLKTKQMDAALKQKHAQEAFAAEQRRETLKSLAEVQRESMKATIDADAKARAAEAAAKEEDDA